MARSTVQLTTQAAGLNPIIRLMLPLHDPILDAQRIPHIIAHDRIQRLTRKITLRSRRPPSLRGPPRGRRVILRGRGVAVFVVEGVVHGLVDASEGGGLVVAVCISGQPIL